MPCSSLGICQRISKCPSVISERTQGVGRRNAGQVRLYRVILFFAITWQCDAQARRGQLAVALLRKRRQVIVAMP